MTDPERHKFKNNFLSWALFFYLIALLSIQPGVGDPDRIRIPAFTLLLLILVQIIFPNFRLSKLSNFIAISMIILSSVVIYYLPIA